MFEGTLCVCGPGYQSENTGHSTGETKEDRGEERRVGWHTEQEQCRPHGMLILKETDPCEAVQADTQDLKDAVQT